MDAKVMLKRLTGDGGHFLRGFAIHTIFWMEEANISVSWNRNTRFQRSQVMHRVSKSGQFQKRYNLGKKNKLKG